MKVRATTSGTHLFGDELFVQGRLEVQWSDNTPWHKISIDNYRMENWNLTLLVWKLAHIDGFLEFEHVDLEQLAEGDDVVPQTGENINGSNAPSSDS